MKKLNFLAALLFALSSLVFFSCETEDDSILYDGNYTNGVVIVSEGNWGANGSLAFYNLDSMKLYNEVYQAANGYALGQTVQAFTQAKDKGFIVEKGSGSVKVVNLENMKNVKSFTDLTYPSAIAFDGKKTAYLTNGKGFGDDKIYIIDTESLTITDSLNTRIGPDKMAINNNNLYVVHLGGWSVDSFMTVINTKTNEVTDSVELANAPSDLVIDANGDIWVICNYWADLTSTLFKVDGATFEVEQEFELTEKIQSFGGSILSISPDKKTIYLEANGIMAIDYNATSLPSTKLIENTSAYGLDVNPKNGDIWVMSGNTAKVYTADGDSVDTYTVGAFANAAVYINN